MGEFKLIIKPDETEAEAAEVYVDGTIGGHPYRFLLDTGAGISSVEYDDYTATFIPVGKNHSSGVFAASSQDLIMVPDIEFGSVTRINVAIVRLAESTAGFRNLIGMDILKDYRCHFLFAEQRVLVDEKPDPEAGYSVHELFLDRKFHPYVAVQFGSVSAKAVWDTGASLTVVDTNFIQQHPTFFQEAGQSTGTDSTGFTMQTPMFIMAESLIGDQVFPPHTAAGVDLSQVNATIETPMDMILGYNLLSKANWLFDFPQKQWAISKWLGV